MKALNKLNMKDYSSKIAVLALLLFFSIPVHGSAISDREVDKVMNEIPLHTEFDCSKIESDLVLEDWMTEPFDQGIFEIDLVLEDWMTEPFGNSFNEPELTVENWMTRPFGNTVGESDLAVESRITEVY